jgi:hypothetical protein
VWLDTDGDSAIDAPSLRWLEAHPAIDVRRFSLNALIEKHVSTRPVAARDRFVALRRLGRIIHRPLATHRSRRDRWQHPFAGQAYRHSSLLFPGFNASPAYRADLARVLIPLEHHATPSLHVSLDTCFLADVRPLCGDVAWTCRGGKHEFASPALLYLPDGTRSAALAAKGRALGSFLPWVLFTDETCLELGIERHPARLFDPVQDPSSLLYGSVQRFFCKRDAPALDLYALSQERHLAVRWHDGWAATPSVRSIYTSLLKDYERPQAPAAQGSDARPVSSTARAHSRSLP